MYCENPSIEFTKINTAELIERELLTAMVRGEKQNEFAPDYELKLYRLLMRACGVHIEKR